MILREIKNMYFPIQRIEYLESTGTQYIDTEVYANLDTSVDVKFCFTEIFPDNAIISADSGSADLNSFTLEYFTGIVFSIDGGSGAAYKGTTERALEWFEVNASKRGLVINNVFYSSRYQLSKITTNYPLFMFAYGRNGVPIIFGKSRITYLKIYNNGTLIRDFIPVRVGSVGYMYDRVSKRLFGNKGTGNFVLGQDVDSGLQQIYQNRLIEGVDYETYDWLRSTNGAQIGLNYTNNGNYEVELKGKELKSTGTDASQILGTTFTWTSAYLKIAIRKSTGNLMFANNSAVYPSAYQEFELKAINSSDSSFTNVIINGGTYTLNKKYNLQLRRLFYWYNGNYSQHTEGCVGHLKVDNYCNMYPCKLLRSIPRNLDAQCKERVAGEYGMIDLISGKFYGNVANSGTFTVENDNNE